MGSINEKLGLKKATRKRAATHARTLVTDARCPKCSGRHVVENQIHGVATRLCGSCGHLWTP